MLQPKRKEIVKILNKQLDILEDLESKAFVAKRPKEEIKSIKSIHQMGLKLISILNDAENEISLGEFLLASYYCHTVAELLSTIQSSIDNYKLN